MKKILKITLFAAVLVLAAVMVGCKNGPGGDAQTFPGGNVSETKAPIDPIDTTPEFFNPLTGLAADADYSGLRPASIMINNIKESLPQVGISKADIMYECLAEGGITRMLMVVQDYKNVGVVGSVRSSRDYYLDLAQNHDAIYVHAGGSDAAYSNISSRNISNLDGVGGIQVLPDKTVIFYRDQERLKTMATEHTMMTTGEGIAAGVEYKKYRTDIIEDFDNPMNFIDYTAAETKYTDAALHVNFQFSYYQEVDYEYDSVTGMYKRFQYAGQPHMDSGNDTQLAFKNVIIIFCDTRDSGDSKHHLIVDTKGTGDGYYITNGTYTPITWEKETRDSQIKYLNPDGSELLFNRGKTMVNVCMPSVKDEIDFNKQ